MTANEQHARLNDKLAEDDDAKKHPKRAAWERAQAAYWRKQDNTRRKAKRTW